MTLAGGEDCGGAGEDRRAALLLAVLRQSRDPALLARLEAALPEPDRPAFRQVIDAERPRYEPPLQALRAARRAVDEALARDPFDPAALRALRPDTR